MSIREDIISKFTSTSQVVPPPSAQPPVWVNDVTQLNESNLNKMSSGIMFVVNKLNDLISSSASDLKTLVNSIGAFYKGDRNSVITNDLDNNDPEDTNYSFVAGANNIASNDYQFIRGKYNASEPTGSGIKYVDIVGWGNADNDRKNIYALDTDGNLYIKGNVFFGEEQQSMNIVFSDTDNKGNIVISRG